jgi:molybdate transport system substrate-binding protein
MTKLLALFFVLILSVNGVSAAEVKVFAAISLKDALSAISAKYEPLSKDKLQFNLQGSNVLALQIMHGAPADVFFSADEAQMDKLAQAKAIDPATRQDIVFNQLAVVVPNKDPLLLQSLADLAGPKVKHLALGDPRSVPAGVYAMEYLEKAGVWAQIEPRVVPCENVRAALAAVESGNVEAGIVYKTDAQVSKKVHVAFVPPPEAGITIAYPAAVVHDSAQAAAAQRLITYLQGAEARAIFARYGFIVAPAHGK